MRNWDGRIRNGMKVKSADGHDLGKVSHCGGAGFAIEKGIFFPRDHLATWADVADVSDDEVHLLARRDDLMRLEGRAAREERGDWAPPGTDDPVIADVADDDHAVLAPPRPTTAEPEARVATGDDRRDPTRRD
jgi:hypothetical protein